MEIDFANLQYQYQLYKKQIDEKIQAVLNKSNFIMGEEIAQFEQQLEKFTTAKNAITCSSGTDALLLAMMALGVEEGDEVITTPFTFIATAEMISLLKAKPVFADIQPDTLNLDPDRLEQAITSKTKVIIAVSLYGQPSDLGEINRVAKKYNLKVIVDGAQSFGATYKGKSEVHHCDIFTASFFPAKPIGCYGDGGAVLTNNDEYAERIRMLRVHGQNKRYHHKYIGIGGRLDTIQAAVLIVKLEHYQEEISLRNKVAERYTEFLKDIYVVPTIRADRTCVWAQYTLRVTNRNELQTALKAKGVPTAVHYPMPLHLQECFKYLGLKEGGFPNAELASGEVLSLPMNAFLTEEQISYITSGMIKG